MCVASAIVSNMLERWFRQKNIYTYIIVFVSVSVPDIPSTSASLTWPSCH